MKGTKIKSEGLGVESGSSVAFDDFQKDMELSMSMSKSKKPRKRQHDNDEPNANDSFNSSMHGGNRLHFDSDDDGQVPGTSSARARVANNRKRERKNSDSSNEQDPLLKPSIPPHEMLKYCQSLLTMLNDKDPVNSAQFKFFHGYDKPEYVPSDQTNEALKTEMTRYYKYATKLTVVSAKAMAFAISDFLKNPRSVETYPDFPTRPNRSPFHLFMAVEQKRLSVQKSTIKFTERAKIIHELWTKNEKQLQAKYSEQWTNEQREFVGKLDEFIENHEKLMEERREYLLYINKLRNDILALLNKNEGGGKKTPTKMNGKAKKPKMTAFDFYKQSKKDKYLDLPPEEREKKLLKRFNKIDPGQMEIFESLAANQ